MRSFINAVCGGATMAALVFGAGDAIARDITIPMDEVRIVTFATPVSTVYVGNPSIADVTVIDSRRVFLLGKAFGTTNLVALDPKGNAAVSERVTVYGRQAGTVTVHHGGAQTTYACAGARCEAAPVPGDENSAYFEPVIGQRDKLAGQALAAGGGNANQ